MSITTATINFITQEGDVGYRRLTKSQPVGLRHAGYVIYVEDVVKNTNNEVIELAVKCVPVANVDTKPKAFIHWVSIPINITVRLFDPL